MLMSLLPTRGKGIYLSDVPNSQLNFIPLPTWVEVRKICIEHVCFEVSTALSEDSSLLGSYGV
jgi:hypothetical protein